MEPRVVENLKNSKENHFLAYAE
jgi:hypothetical protein